MKKNFVKQNLGFPRFGKTASEASVRNQRCLKEGGRGKPCERGFTLIEVLIYIAVLAIIIFSVSVFFDWAIKSYTKARAMSEVSDTARRAMETMLYEIREAKSIYTPTSTSTQLSLETKTATYIDFYLCGVAKTILCLKQESQNPLALTPDTVEVNSLEFILIATTIPSVQINLVFNFKNPQNRPESQAIINLTSSASLRSY